MKKLFLLFIICVSTFANAQKDKVSSQTSKSIETVYKDSKVGISTVYNDLKSTTPQIKNALESLSKELKTTTDSLWLILVKQQLVWSWCFLVLIFSSFFNWFLFYKRNLKGKLTEQDFVKGEKTIYEKTKNPDYSSYASKGSVRAELYFDKGKTIEEILIPIVNSNNHWFKYLHLIICLVLSGLSAYHFSDMLTGFINPEFGALKTIAEVVRNLK